MEAPLIVEEIERIYAEISDSVYTTGGGLSFDEVLQQTISLCDAINAVPEGETEAIWYIEAGLGYCLSDYLVGAYWLLCDIHAPNAHLINQAESAIGSIFSPGYSSLDDDAPEGDIYGLLLEMWQESEEAKR